MNIGKVRDDEDLKIIISPIIIYQGTGLNDNGFEDIYSSQTTVKLFKFNNEPSDQPIVAIDSWNMSIN